MTLSLIKSPAAVSLAGNDILFKINTDNQYSSEGTKARIGLTWSTGDAAGEKFNLSWGENIVEFTAAASPDDSGTQYPAYVSGSVDAWVESLAPYLQANYLLSNDFDIVYDDSHLVMVIEARAVGSEFTLTLDEDTSGVAEDDNDAGTDQTLRDFYQIICRIWLYVYGDNPPNTILGEDRLTPDDDGYVRFKIQEYLKPEITALFSYPEDNSALVIERDDMVKMFYVEYGETYDNVVYKLFSTFAALKYAIRGKVSQQKEAALNELDITFFDELSATRMFLSWHPASKTISKWQPEKLYYLLLEERAAIWVFAHVTFTDGSTTTKTLYTATVDQYTMLEICCGHDIIGLQYEAKEVDYYTVYVSTHAGAISESRTFVIDREYREFEKVFLFKNSLDIYETLRTTGVHEKENEFEHSLYEQGITVGDLSWYEESNLGSFMEETFKANSGWITREELDWTNDFIMSTDRYIIEDYQLFRILVTSKKVFQRKDDEYLYSIEFEFKKSAQAAYSNMSSFIPIISEEAVLVLSEDDEITLIE
jgi:hypothetical protein